jgi:NodT family efflux transporter outer membrane factor (OMF) lipoprotein
MPKLRVPQRGAKAGLLPVIAAVFAGCNFAPKYSPPALDPGAGFKEASTNKTAWKPAAPADSAPRGPWWKLFEDPELNALEDEAMKANQSIAAASANFLSARALLKEARAGYFPTVSLAPSASRSKASSRNAAPSARGPISSFALPLDASWEPDLWGSVRNSVAANAAGAQATLADLEGLRLTVGAEVAVDYFQLRSLDSLKVVLDSTVAAYDESYRLTKARYSTGIASDEDVAQAETQLRTTQAQSTDLGIQRAQLEHAIATLTGRPAAFVAIPAGPLKATPAMPEAALPSELLQRRPDIAAAERRVAAANAQVGVARAAWFPSLNLTGSVGYQSSTLQSLIGWPSIAWSVGAGLSETLFDAGRRSAVTEQARAALQAASATYRQTVLGAIQEVEDSLSTLRILKKELEEEDAAVAASGRYLSLASDRYKLGIDSYLNVITAQTALLTNQKAAVNLRSQQMAASVQLLKALGGGWRAEDLPSPSAIQKAFPGKPGK